MLEILHLGRLPQEEVQRRFDGLDERRREGEDRLRLRAVEEGEVLGHGRGDALRRGCGRDRHLAVVRRILDRLDAGERGESVAERMTLEALDQRFRQLPDAGLSVRIADVDDLAVATAITIADNPVKALDAVMHVREAPKLFSPVDKPRIRLRMNCVMTRALPFFAPSSVSSRGPIQLNGRNSVNLSPFVP